MDGGVSNVDIDGNNALQIKVIGVVISTFETLPTGSTCCGTTDAGRIAIGGIGAKRSRRNYALSRIRLRCVRGLLSHNDSDPLQ